MRWEQGRWSEERIMEAINGTRDFRAVPYGRSQIGPADATRLREYWADYAAAETAGKRPDILVLRRGDYKWATKLLGRDPTVVGEKEFKAVVRKSVCGIEAENSLWIGSRMKDFEASVPLPRLDMKSPNIWVKDEDLPCLLVWMHIYRKPILVVQVFYDLAYAIPLLHVQRQVTRIRRARGANKNRLQKELGVVFRKQGYADSRSTVAAKKLVYVTHHSVCTQFGSLDGRVRTSAKVVKEPNGKILPYVSFAGGRLSMTTEGDALLEQMASGGRR